MIKARDPNRHLAKSTSGVDGTGLGNEPGSWVDALLDAFGIHQQTPESGAGLGLTLLLGDASQRQRVQRVHRVAQAALQRRLHDIVESVDGDFPMLLLKGRPLQKRLFQDRLFRSTGDIDLLVLPGDLELARQRLIGLGYRRKSMTSPRMWAHNQESWLGPGPGVEVELHWSLTTPGIATIPIWRCFESSIAYRFRDGLQVDVLSDDLLFVHLALHFHHHMGFAKGLLDVAGWCDALSDRVDLARLRRWIERWGLVGIVQWPLHTIAGLTGRRPPLFDAEADRSVRALAAVSARAMSDCLCREMRSDMEASLVAIMPRVGPWRAVPMEAATMAVCDGWSATWRGMLRPLLLGPHCVGRAVHHWFQ